MMDDVVRFSSGSPSGEGARRVPGLLIDWLTLRIPLTSELDDALYARLMDAKMFIQCFDSQGVIRWEKAGLDFDALRSDTMGLCWNIQGDGARYYLVIGGSPASLRYGINVFGDLDIRSGAEILIRTARKGLQAILPPVDGWQCRRVDITGNYVLPDAQSVKQALRMLLNTDAARRKASSARRGGDTVMWNTTSDLTKGKAYHKGPQLSFSCRRHGLDVTPEQLELSDRLLRLEHTRGARWFRREEEAGRRWQDMTEEDLERLYLEFFERLTEGVEVKDMNETALVALIKDANGITEGRAKAAFTTYRIIRLSGFEKVKGFMSRSTFYLHLRYLRNAGITDFDLYNGNVVPIRPVRVVLAQPVASWEDIRRAA